MKWITAIIIVTFLGMAALIQTTHSQQQVDPMMLQEMLNKMSGHLNLCIKDAAMERVERLQLQQELDRLRKELSMLKGEQGKNDEKKD